MEAQVRKVSHKSGAMGLAARSNTDRIRKSFWVDGLRPRPKCLGIHALGLSHPLPQLHWPLNRTRFQGPNLREQQQLVYLEIRLSNPGQ